LIKTHTVGRTKKQANYIDVFHSGRTVRSDGEARNSLKCWTNVTMREMRHAISETKSNNCGVHFTERVAGDQSL